MKIGAVIVAMLRTAFYAMKRDPAPGVDGMTWETYEADLDKVSRTQVREWP